MVFGSVTSSGNVFLEDFPSLAKFFRALRAVQPNPSSFPNDYFKSSCVALTLGNALTRPLLVDASQRSPFQGWSLLVTACCPERTKLLFWAISLSDAGLFYRFRAKFLLSVLDKLVKVQGAQEIIDLPDLPQAIDIRNRQTIYQRVRRFNRGCLTSTSALRPFKRLFVQLPSQQESGA